jgi:TonB-linked SusC/RagA family outer membrane protein
MEKKIKKQYLTISFLNKDRRKLWLTGFLFLLITLFSSSVFAKTGHTVRGVIFDETKNPRIEAAEVIKENYPLSITNNTKGEFSLSIADGKQVVIIPETNLQQAVVSGRVTDSEGNALPGVNIIEKETMNGTTTDQDGNYSITVSSSESVLVFSYVGYLSEEMQVGNQLVLNMTLIESLEELGEVVVVGYGKQKKESVVGAISQTTGEVLERTGGVSNIGAALTGNIPGLITMQGTGEPGDENPIILIRGQGTWNYGNPLVLIDGIERSMNEIDFKSVESISVLKDASATAVFGVKGANGVILITTRRGSEGRANISVSSNVTMKIPSKIPGKYDAYDALKVRNTAIEREVNITPALFQYYTPIAELDKYRNPSSPEEAERYPNVDWQEASFKDYTMSYNNNINISGGSSFVRYFTSMDYLHEGDLMNIQDNYQGYTPGYGYDRLNFRSNLDFNITNTTTLSTNLSGSHATKKETWSGFEYTMWQAAYSNPPDAFPVKYSDGTWGYWPANEVDVQNSVKNVSTTGVRNVKTSIINTDFTLTQDLSMLLKGLNVKGTYSMDNTFLSWGGVWHNWGTGIEKWISPEGDTVWNQVYGATKYDYITPEWSDSADGMRDRETIRKVFYQIQLYYEKQISRHNVTAMGLFSRDKYARGSTFPHYREDWVFRTTYNYNERYFVEFNGAYNGSEKFGKGYRFDFFPSAALGWMLSNESFMKNISWLDRFKIRGSYGLVGNDEILDKTDVDYELYRWLYSTTWEYGGQSLLGRSANATSPYNWYNEGTIGNSEIHWETVEKKNLGIEFSFLNGLIEGSVDFFNDYRKEILVKGEDRAVVDYLGGVPPSANLGEVKVNGYEIETGLNHRFAKDLRLWANVSMAHAKDEIIFADDPELLPAYQKKQGYPIDQYRSQLLGDFVNTWDEVYGSTEWEANDNKKLPGEFNILDFNADGIIDAYDGAPNGFPERPQNTYNWSLGCDYKGFSVFVQFYGVSNVTRYVGFSNFSKQVNVVYEQGDYWSKDNTNAESFVPRYVEKFDRYGNFYAYDGSYLRLKNVEIAYTFQSSTINRIGINSLRIFLNGNNLYLWTKMPDDRESNLGERGGAGAYPTMRRINLGVNIVL